MDGTVGVVIPAHNNSKLLKSTLAAVSAASGSKQVVVVDDGSSPAIKLIKRYQVELVRTTRNHGPSAARNLGLKNISQVDFVHFLDADDLVTPDFYLHMTAAAARYDQPVVCLSSALCDPELALSKQLQIRAITLVRNTILRVFACLSLPLPAALFYATSTSRLLFPRSILGSRPFNPAWRQAEEWELVTRLYEQGHQVYVVPHRLIQFRYRSDSETSRQLRQQGTSKYQAVVKRVCQSGSSFWCWLFRLYLRFLPVGTTSQLVGASQWSTASENQISASKRDRANLSVKVRTQQFQLYHQLLQPSAQTTVLDVGTTPDETLVDSNLFEKLYPYSRRLTISSVEDCSELVPKYQLKKFVSLRPDQPYPFKKYQFDQVVSWATLEHVGSFADQQRFLVELDRVGHQVFVTTPFKWFPFELHTEWWLLHWLPDPLWRWLLRQAKKTFWANEQNLRLVGWWDAIRLLPSHHWRVRIFWSFGWLPTHLVFYKTKHC